MAITNITNTGTTLNPKINAYIDEIKFTNIPGGNKGTKGSTFWNQSSNAQVWKDNGDSTQWKPSVNAVDIDWNGAQVNGSTINTTGELLAKIADLETLVRGLYASLELDNSGN